MDRAPTSEASDSTSDSLITRVRDHDPQAWTKLTQLYGPLVYGWARKANLQPDDAADVTQDVFTAVATGIHTRGQGANNSFRGWLWGITRNKISDHFRRRLKAPTAVGGTDAQQFLQQVPDAPPEDSDPSAKKSATSDLARRAASLIKTDFHPRTWRAFWLAVVERRFPVDIADELEMTAAAVYKAKSRVLARLRDEFDGLLD